MRALVAIQPQAVYDLKCLIRAHAGCWRLRRNSSCVLQTERSTASCLHLHQFQLQWLRKHKIQVIWVCNPQELYTHTHRHTHRNTQRHSQTHTHTHRYTTHTLSQTHTHIHTDTPTHTHSQTNTHTHWWWRRGSLLPSVVRQLFEPVCVKCVIGRWDGGSVDRMCLTVCCPLHLFTSTLQADWSGLWDPFDGFRKVWSVSVSPPSDTEVQLVFVSEAPAAERARWSFIRKSLSIMMKP